MTWARIRTYIARVVPATKYSRDCPLSFSIKDGDKESGSSKSKGEKRKGDGAGTTTSGKKDEPKEKKKKEKEDSKPRGFARGLNAERIIGKCSVCY